MSAPELDLTQFEGHTPSIGGRVYVRVRINGVLSPKPYCGTIRGIADGKCTVECIITATPLRMFTVLVRRVYPTARAALARVERGKS